MEKALYDAVKETFMTMGSRMVDLELHSRTLKRQSTIDYYSGNANAIYEEYKEWIDAGKHGLEYEVTHHEYFGKEEIKKINAIIKQQNKKS
jgi:hypothetical protein